MSIHPQLPQRPPDAPATSLSRRLLARARDYCPPQYSCRHLVPVHPLARPLMLAGILAILAALPAGLWLSLFLLWAVFLNGIDIAIRTRALIPARRKVPLLPDFLTNPRPPPARLPRITLLVPLFREGATLPALVAALNALDYPRDRLDILFLTEEIDTETARALATLALPAHMRRLVVPRDRLQTKPKAMNYALPHCYGDILGIYDAEDRPAPDQLQRVAATFAAAPANLGCLQGRLDYYNARRNLLTRCFTIEYAMWFRVAMPAVRALGLPVPLGGTTLFVRRDVLEQVGGWDAYNVTEDADLGMRLARFGWRTGLLDSTTFEEASYTPLRWIRQRSRWLKGFVMTWASHMRAPHRLWRELGPAGFLGMQGLLLSGVTGFAAAPLYALLWARHFGVETGILPPVPAPLLALFTATLGLALGLQGLVALKACLPAPRRHLLVFVPLLALYWPLATLAAYKALFELVFAPFYWDKTPHGEAAPPRSATTSPRRQPKVKSHRPMPAMTTSARVERGMAKGG